jgi:hypothetical protein
MGDTQPQPQPMPAAISTIKQLRAMTSIADCQDPTLKEELKAIQQKIRNNVEKLSKYEK